MCYLFKISHLKTIGIRKNYFFYKNYPSIIFKVSDAVMIPTIFDFFETRMHLEYLINGTSTFAGVSKSTIGGTESMVSASFAFFNYVSPKSARCFTIPSSETTPTMSELLKTGI